ncbi:MAG: PKD domain-containing protein [Acidobacteria bacterium]|nr:PKD domain-containing protein [Acidobacteriota bacterium]
MRRSKSTFFRAAAIGAALLASACTLKKQDTPSLTGPSELGTSVTISVTPDVLSQDGASQSLVTITVRDQNGQPVRNQSLRAEIFVNGTIVDFGTLSARNVVTDANGRATLVYTAPPSAGSVDNGTLVQIMVVPAGTDFANATARTVTIRLVPSGIVIPPDGLNPSFTFTPTAPLEGDSVFFVACSDPKAPCETPSNPIVSYSWTFGDGGRASGPSATHAYPLAGNYVITLTVTDAFGRSRSASRQVTVGAGTKPTAAFTFSPNPTQLNQPTHFNASGSSAPAGRRIATYTWDFGDGTQQSTASPLIDHVYGVARTFVVTLTVTDDAGKVSAPATQTITPQ